MPRQPNRRPKIYKGANGRYHCYITVGVRENGSLDRRHIERATPSEVADAIAELEDRMRRGSVTQGRTETVAEWLTHWLENVVKPARKWKTYAAYSPIVRLHIIPRIGQWRLDGSRRRLEPEHVEAMYADLRKTGMAPSYVLQVHRVLRKALSDAVRRGKASRNVCDLFDRPQSRRVKVKPYSLTDAAAILRAANDDPMSVRWLLGILLGLRQGEALGLRWHNVHLEDNPPHIEIASQIQRHTWEHGCEDPVGCASRHCRTRPCPDGCKRHRGRNGCPPPCKPGCTRHARACPDRRNGGLVEVEVKSEYGVRVIPLSPDIEDALRQRREEQQRVLAEYGRRWNRDMLVCTSPDGKPIDPRRDHERWEQLLQRAGVADGRLHAARHTTGTLLVATGTDISVVQEILGHSDIRVTKGYVSVAADLKREAVNRIADALLNGELSALLQRNSATEPEPR